MGHSWRLSLNFCLFFATSKKNLPMGFKMWSSGAGTVRATNCHTSTAHFRGDSFFKIIRIFLYFIFTLLFWLTITVPFLKAGGCLEIEIATRNPASGFRSKRSSVCRPCLSITEQVSTTTSESKASARETNFRSRWLLQASGSGFLSLNELVFLTR